MSEFNPFSAAPEEQAPAVEEAAEGRDKKVLAVLGGVVALALAGGAYLFLGGGGEEELEAFVPPARPAAAAPAASPSPQAQVPVQTAIRLGRSPFDVKYIAPAPAPEQPDTPAAPAAPVTGGAPGVIVVPVQGGGSTGGGTTAPAPGTGAPAPDQPTAQEYKLILLRVFGEGVDQSASFSIDGREQTAKVGSTFGATAEILLVELTEGPDAGQWTASLQVGEERIDVKLGETVYVR